VETVTITEKLQQAILESKTEEEMWAIAQADGVVTMRQDAILKCMDGLVPFVEINTL
jgi:type II secretory ATPase GspE/PulE/Tfp pilus assembly ATPase PilB-like protein